MLKNVTLPGAARADAADPGTVRVQDPLPRPAHTGRLAPAGTGAGALPRGGRGRRADLDDLARTVHRASRGRPGAVTSFPRRVTARRSASCSGLGTRRAVRVNTSVAIASTSASITSDLSLPVIAPRSRAACRAPTNVPRGGVNHSRVKDAG